MKRTSASYHNKCEGEEEEFELLRGVCVRNVTDVYTCAEKRNLKYNAYHDPSSAATPAL